ncbi:MAG: PAS domain S-box protein, partial [Aquabacterium sp.]|nr:PAS domain S-box protein [Aquabacterium sp.]
MPADDAPPQPGGQTISDLLAAGNDEAYRRLVDGIRDYAVFFLTPQGHIASWNAGAQAIKGYAPHEIIGRHFSVFYTDDALARGWPAEELRRAAASGRLEDEGWRLRKDGSRFWANVVITAVRGADGTLLGYSKVTRDLTERRAQEQRLAESERNLRLLVSSVVDYAIYRMDPQGVITSWNRGAERIKGYSAQEAIGRHFSMFYLPQDVADGVPQQGLRRAERHGRHATEGWRVRKDGSRLWASITITAIRDEDGTLLGYSKVTRDLTERRQHEEELRQREENLRLLVEGVKDHAMFLLDEDGRVRTWNSGARSVFGFDADQVLGHDASLLYTEDDRQAGQLSAELASAQRSGVLRAEGWRRRAQGERFWAETATTHLTHDDGRTRGFVQIVRDLTERRRVEALEDEGRRLSEFIAMLSHELRNPLAPIRHATAVLQHAPDAALAARSVEVIDRQLTHLTRLVDDLLDVTRLTRGKIRLDAQPVDLGETVRQAVESTLPTLRGHGHALDLHLPSAPLRVSADPTRLNQVVVNLVNNAAKYTPAGGRIEVRLQAREGFAVLQVTDNGIGMSQALLQRVFDPFVQGARGLDRSEGGLGIGLALVRSIVVLHGGTVTAASAGPGQGSTFTVTLPLHPAGSARAPAPQDAQPQDAAPADAGPLAVR